MGEKLKRAFKVNKQLILIKEITKYDCVVKKTIIAVNDQEKSDNHQHLLAGQRLNDGPRVQK
jgi:Ulp1 family protease